MRPLGDSSQRQEQVMSTAIIVLSAACLLVVWFLLFSRIPYLVRIVVGALGFMALGTGYLLFDFKGVTGDLVPIVEFRWTMKPAPTVANSGTNNAASGDSTHEAPDSDFPQFLGPDRDNRLPGPVLATNWSENPPEIVWSAPIGPGWAGFAIADGVAVTLEQADDEERVVAFDLFTGDVKWRAAYPARYDTPVGGVGPRTTPLIFDGRVYTTGARGDLNCWDLETGERVWGVNVLTDTGTSPSPSWGYAASPLRVDGAVVVGAGGANGVSSVVAYDAVNGERVWSGGSNQLAYSSPVLMELAGVEQVVSFNHASVTGHDATDGRELWSYPWGKGQPHVAVPVRVSTNEIVVSSGYGVGAERLAVNRDDGGNWRVEQVWRSIRMKAKFANVVRYGDFIYGLDDGMLACIDVRDGSQRWKEGRYGHGQLLGVGDLMLITTEQGGLVLFEPNPDEPRELGRVTVFDHKQWNPPALAGRWLLLRTDREVRCLTLPLAETDEPAETTEAPIVVP
jgi:outer membrane protein assembly factor BamB